MTDAAPKRIWADQENLTWVEECPGEAMRDYEAEYILASEVAALIREAEARGMERAAEICAGLADQVSDAALTGLPEQARLRESMEAAFTKARHAIRAEAAAIRRAAEGTGT